VTPAAIRPAGLIPPKTATGKPSITKQWLDALKHPVAEAVRRARKMSQLRTTFVASVREHEVRGRVHCTFNQVVTSDEEDKTVGGRYGRLSCCDPNLQQQPARDPEIGPMWRSVYVPDHGCEWGSLDYSQQEPGLAIHFAVAAGPDLIGERGYESAVAAMEAKWRDPSLDYHTNFTAMVHGEYVFGLDKKALKLLRDPCKNIFLGICYGEGGPKLCRDLGYPTQIIEDHHGRKREVAGPEGQALLDLVDARVPYVRKISAAVERVAKERGFIVTGGGRQLHFPTDQWGNYDWTWKAFNRLIQGTAADQMKTATAVLHEAGVPLQLQVHDELDLSLAGGRPEGERYAREMVECFPLRVPVRVDVEVGPSWGKIA